MSDVSPLKTVAESNVKKPQNKKKTAFIVSLIAGMIVIGLSVVLVSNSWTAFGDAKSDVFSTDDILSEANSQLSIANHNYDEAATAWLSWYSCYLTTSWRYDWLCGNESSLTTDLDYAESLVNTAKLSVSRANTQLTSAKSELDVAAESFNMSAVIWGSVSGGSVIVIIVLGILTTKKSRKQRKAEQLESRPDWDCPECSTHNEGGIFCVGCGFSKAEAQEAKTAIKNEPENKPEA